MSNSEETDSDVEDVQLSFKINETTQEIKLRNGYNLQLSSKTLRFTFYGILAMYKDVLVYLAEEENQTNNLSVFGSVYGMYC